MPDDLVTEQGVDDEGESADGDGVGEPADLELDPPASPVPTGIPHPDGPGQELAEGEG